MNQGRTKGEGWSTANKLKPPSNFIAGRPKAALLFWFFGDFRCGVLLFMAILVIYKYIKIGKNSCWETAALLAVAGGVCDSVSPNTHTITKIRK